MSQCLDLGVILGGSSFDSVNAPLLSSQTLLCNKVSEQSSPVITVYIYFIVSTTGINTDMGIGDALAVTLITVAGSTSHFVSSVAIDGRTTGISTYWTGGAIPTAGGGSNVDIYAFNILKTADNTFTVIANQTLTSS